jgi:glycogen operon protein
MKLGGDELSHSQGGNNNAYCQDNEITWLSWELDERQKAFLDFTRKLLFIRRSQPVLHRRKFFLGRAIRGSDIKDISFFNPAGQEMSDEDWNAGFVKCLGVRLAGDLINDENERGEPIVGETLLILANAHWEPIPFTLPETREDHIWDRILDTADPRDEPMDFRGGGEYPLRDRSFAVLAARPPQFKGHTATPEQIRAVLEERRPGPAPKPTPI